MENNQGTTLASRLDVFFQEYKASQMKQPPDALAAWLPGFLEAYRAHRPAPVKRAEKPSQPCIDATKLETWLLQMRQPIMDARRGAFNFDPWEVAGLKRNEVRNSAVLAWLLNPRGSHGLGDMALRGLLTEVRKFEPSFPEQSGKSCRVRVESNPDGESNNRIDIEIDDSQFYLIIEVKIDAPEGTQQMERYGKIAEVVAGQRPWALVFLTPKGRASQTAGSYRVFQMTWWQLAVQIAHVIKSNTTTPARKGPDRHMAERAVLRFLKQMQTF